MGGSNRFGFDGSTKLTKHKLSRRCAQILANCLDVKSRRGLSLSKPAMR